MFNDKLPVQVIQNDLLKEKEIRLFVFRLDLIHPQISGNKWFKLKYNIQKAREEGHDTLLTFGGAFSNHIAAAAAACKEFGFKSIGIIRGEETLPLNPRLAFAKACGMHLHYVTRTAYRTKKEDLFINELKNIFGRFYLVPEGGSNALAIKGCAEIISLAKDLFRKEYKEELKFDYACCASGTGATVGGIAASLAENEKALGFAVLKGGDFLKQDISDLLEQSGHLNAKNRFDIITDYHFGGYAKHTGELDQFIDTFIKEQNIPVEFVYTGKLFYGIFDLINKNYFKPGSKILAIHTGGVF